MDEKGNITRMPDMTKLKKDIFSISISNKKTMQTIKKLYKKYKIILEPHGAVGFLALQKYLNKTKDNHLSIVLETAHPAKFSDDIKELLNIDPKLPESMKKFENKQEKYITLNVNYSQFKEFLKTHT